MAHTPSISSQLPPQEQLNLKNSLDYSQVNSLTEVWSIASDRFQNLTALDNPHDDPPVKLSYRDLWQQIQTFATALQSLGLDSLDDLPPRVVLFSENSPRWFIADQGIIAAGAADAVRSSQADRDELLYIAQHSQSRGLVLENLATLEKLQSSDDEELRLSQDIAWVVLLSEETPPEETPFRLLNFSQFMALGDAARFKLPQSDRSTLATLIYTSGTTGRPKGAMLTHGNLLHQVNAFRHVFVPQAGDRALSILPSWHVYERTCEYFLLSQGCAQLYTSLRYFKNDLKEHQPQIMIGVPRLWESIYEGVQKNFREQPANKQKLVNFFIGISRRHLQAQNIRDGLTLDATPPSGLERLMARLQALALTPLHGLGHKLVYSKVRAATGGKIKFLISGGGSLAQHIDEFFAMIGIKLLVGYGLTETAPVLTVRRAWANLQGSAGLPLVETEIRIVDPETGRLLPQGERGLVLGRGSQVMRGYFNNPEATEKAIDSEGWFNTGDLGCLLPGGHLRLTGRAKDTIVLSNGENIEPQPIEDACVRSAYIDQIMLVGQDQRQLGAVIVPNWEALAQWGTAQGLTVNSEAVPPLDLSQEPVQQLFREELSREVKNRPGYRADDRIGPFRLVQESFSIENGMMTQTLKIKRPVVQEHYRDTINEMFG
ncbi:AMP-binding protein [Sodalinema gerasimenkoae]|uniref:AMP-binding protein n=1 Tax=Sodalinema gerasimenkoae TaxID=2862348 RepID=UPI001359BBBD|nr:AMP-binding protein [Sodalinema gerasimenkoae]